MTTENSNSQNDGLTLEDFQTFENVKLQISNQLMSSAEVSHVKTSAQQEHEASIKELDLMGKEADCGQNTTAYFCELRPRYVLIENAPALLIRGIDVVLGNLAACGYDAEWQVLPAAAFGAPHLRERLFIVAYTNKIRRDETVFVQPFNFDESDAWPEWQDVELRRTDGGQLWALPNGRDIWLGDEISIDEEELKLIAGYGDAVVSQVAEWIGKQILEFDVRSKS